MAAVVSRPGDVRAPGVLPQLGVQRPILRAHRLRAKADSSRGGRQAAVGRAGERRAQAEDGPGLPPELDALWETITTVRDERP